MNVPNYSAGVDIAIPTSGAQYTCPYDGVYVCCFNMQGNNIKSYLYVNGVKTAYVVSISSTANANKTSMTIRLKKNDKIYWSAGATGDFVYSSTYYPLKSI